ncbi:hypothetical protein ISCGN_005160 [Ixodes scapularis]
MKIGANHFESNDCSLMPQRCALSWHTARHDLSKHICPIGAFSMGRWSRECPPIIPTRARCSDVPVRSLLLQDENGREELHLSRLQRELPAFDDASVTLRRLASLKRALPEHGQVEEPHLLKVILQPFFFSTGLRIVFCA